MRLVPNYKSIMLCFGLKRQAIEKIRSCFF